MRSIGCGHAAAKRFCGLMNMPPPLRPTPYSRHNKALLNAVKEVSVETMNVAASEIHEIKPEVNEGTGVAKCAISCDGTWQRRGFSSLNGCVTVISIDTGKVLDVEALSKVCKKCKDHEDDEDSPQNASWRVDHEVTARQISQDQHLPWNQREPYESSTAPLKTINLYMGNILVMETVKVFR